MTAPRINTQDRILQADDFRELERARLRALVEADMGLAWQLHAADFQLITPNGFSYSRDVYLGEIETGQLKYLRWEPGPIEVRLHGSVALLRYQAKFEVDSGEGRALALQCWHTDAYELHNELWQVIWSQATAIR
ncbi:MAG: nuclear transport factor 2 family protein [Chloroflexi bacterium]|nr:nuclear transport factor 2 family protein [Chloroflexota bacterium]